MFLKRGLLTFFLFTLTLIFTGSVLATAPPTPPDPPNPPAAPTPPPPPSAPPAPQAPRLLVKFQKDADKQAISRRNEAQIVSEIPKLDVSILSVKDQTESLKRLKAEKIEYAEIDAVASKVSTNDSLYPSQWGLPKISWDLIDASSSSFNTPSVKIAIIDTGVDYNHPDLLGKVDTLEDFDFVNNDSDAMDDDSHGTHVAGIAAASTNNNQGIASVSINSNTILPVKVLDSQGSGFYSWIASGVIYAADHGARVINLSLGGTFNSTTLQDAINYAWDKGVVVVAAAGNNSSTSRFYPAYYTNSLAVWASTQTDFRASFSNYGSWVDIGAPGVSIISSVPFSLDTDGNPDGYSTWNGTSMATPHVAGLAGLLFSQNPTWSNQQIRSKIESTADPVPDRNYRRGRLGKGRVNVYKALN